MLKNLEFDWPALKVAVEGHSYLDTPSLKVSSKAEAKRFLLSYGYDYDDPVVREEVWRIYFESIAFLRTSLLDPGEKIPQDFLSRGGDADILKLLVDASKGSFVDPADMNKADRVKSRWACAILRIMHIISHLDNDVRLENFHFAREQIFARFDEFVEAAGKRRWRFGSGSNAVPLVRYIKKQRKERNSIIIKLLSKPQTVVEEIYDSLGFRFVTENRFDAYRLIQAMVASGAISAPNIQPGRSVNSLLPFDHVKSSVEAIVSELEDGKISQRIAQKKIQTLEQEGLIPLGSLRNPFSSSWYRAVQMTCRQLIVAPDPTFKFWNQIRSKFESSKGGPEILKKIPMVFREKRTFYYPFEIQIMDKESYVESIGGRSRHREYKARQRLMARNRVLRDLI